MHMYYIYIHVYIYIYIYISLFMYIYIYIYIYNSNIYIYIYIACILALPMLPAGWTRTPWSETEPSSSTSSRSRWLPWVPCSRPRRIAQRRGWAALCQSRIHEHISKTKATDTHAPVNKQELNQTVLHEADTNMHRHAHPHYGRDLARSVARKLEGWA